MEDALSQTSAPPSSEYPGRPGFSPASSSSLVTSDVIRPTPSRPLHPATAPPRGSQVVSHPPPNAPCLADLSQMLSSAIASQTPQIPPSHSSLHTPFSSSVLPTPINATTSGSSQVAANPAQYSAAGFSFSFPSSLPSNLFPTTSSLSNTLPLPPPLSNTLPNVNHNFNLATAVPPAQSSANVPRPSPISPLRQQILNEIQTLGPRCRSSFHAGSSVFFSHIQLNPPLPDLHRASQDLILSSLAPVENENLNR
ncbi:proline-rich receptor-like protein kinase PERK8 [Poecilia latipinna]|uniref:proline-rich receptor-like protein kinase PERK8 n=1 Tax=Poecilia latipinna TaxID=48699 RepID=UPI00072E5897|nr:PREDICTED: proline-rich receptor-like protein kinase PERK8 [Poecilia latipinna]